MVEATVVEAYLFLNIDNDKLCLDTFSTLESLANFLISNLLSPIFIFPSIIPIVAGVALFFFIISIHLFVI